MKAGKWAELPAFKERLPANVLASFASFRENTSLAGCLRELCFAFVPTLCAFAIRMV